MWNRRAFLGACGVWAHRAAGFGTARPEVAITMDDFDHRAVPDQWRPRASDVLLGELDKHHVKAAGFIAGKRVDSPDGLAMVRRWRDAGHLIGNHTYSHQHIDAMGLPAFEEDVLRNDRLLGGLLTAPRLFRFPMLKEGGTAETRDGMRAFLKEHGYRNGAVTIDASDWYYSSRLSERLAADPAFDWTLYRAPYLKHIAGRAQYYDGLATELLGRKVRHTLLIHYNLINVLFLGDLLRQFQDLGWGLVDASYAYQDPVFERAPRTVPAGESLIWALAQESGKFGDRLRYPGEDDVYEKPILDALKL